MSTKNKYRSLVDRLFEKTSTGSLRWENDLLDEGYCATVNGRSIVLSKGENYMGEPIIRVSIRDEAGREVESFDDEDVKGATPTITGYEGYWPLMSELFDTAKRQATGADTTLDSILADLS